jgi:hypothetical protein
MTTREGRGAEPSTERLVAAFAAGATAPVLTVVAIMWGLDGFGLANLGYVLTGVAMFGVVFAYVPTAIVAAPVYFVLRRRLAATLLPAVIGGALIAMAAPTLAATLDWGAAGYRLRFWNYLPIIVLSGALGAYGGAVFFLVHNGGQAQGKLRGAGEAQG